MDATDRVFTRAGVAGATSDLSGPPRRAAKGAESFAQASGTAVALASDMTTTSPVPPPPLGPLAPPRPGARAVSIADRVAKGFPPLACVRGFRYFTRGRVAFSNVSEAGLDADVKGKRTLHVRLRVDDGQLAAACTCSAKLLGPARCRHVWATLLEADRQVVLGTLRKTPRTLALVALDATSKPRRARRTGVAG